MSEVISCEDLKGEERHARFLKLGMSLLLTF
jgi:hypothetical protein